MLGQYETVFILTPVLSEDDTKKAISAYVDLLKAQGAVIVHEEHWGLKNLRYPIKKKTTGIYHLVEYKAEGKAIDALEIAFRRDESVLRYLTVRLDKYAVKYNDDKRAGLVGRNKKSSVNQRTGGIIMAQKGDIKYLTATKIGLVKKKYCRFKKNGIKYIDYKDPEFLLKFINEQGKILPRRLSGNSLKFQRKIAQAVKRARHLSLLPYVADLLK